MPQRFFLLSFLVMLTITGCQSPHGNRQLLVAEELLAQGELTRAEATIGEIFQKERLSLKEHAKADSILEMCLRLRRDYRLTSEEMIKKLSPYQPSTDSATLNILVSENKLDAFRIDGRMRYFTSGAGNVFRLDSGWYKRRQAIEGTIKDTFPQFKRRHTGEIIGKSTTSGTPVLPIKMKLNYTLTVKPDVIPAGDTIRCWMPFPRTTQPRQQEVKLLSTEPLKYQLSPGTDLQRTLYLEKIAITHQPTVFKLELSFTSYGQYFDLSPEMIKPYQKDGEIYRQFTKEKPPQIIFNQQIKSLTNKIIGGETNPLLQVRKLYTWINDSVTWASALEYSIMKDIPGYVMAKQHGDCGMQTLLFLSMARSVGIPCKWQSGWMLHPEEVNLHDWAEVWYEGIGWVPLDQSFGLQNSADKKMRDFYITGIDSYRMIVNDDISCPLTPSKKFMRSEPYDFQRGEVEWKGGNLYFNQWSWGMEVSYE